MSPMLTTGPFGDDILHVKKRDEIEKRNVVNRSSGGSGSGSGTTAANDDVPNINGAGDVEKEKEDEWNAEREKEDAEVRDWVRKVSAYEEVGSGEKDENKDKLEK